jgi:hypothetical protein
VAESGHSITNKGIVMERIQYLKDATVEELNDEAAEWHDAAKRMIDNLNDIDHPEREELACAKDLCLWHACI